MRDGKRIVFQLGRILLISIVARLDAQEMDQYRVKAAFLYNFAKFVEWSPEIFHSGNEPFAICVLGQDPFGQALDEVVAGKTIAGHPIALRRIAEPVQTAECRVLFVSTFQNKRTISPASSVKESGVLTVGDAGNALADDVVIKFTLENGKVRFEINLAAAEKEKLRLSSKLLRLATVVRK